VGGVVADGEQRLRVLPGEDLKGAAAFQRAVQVARLPSSFTSAARLASEGAMLSAT
jgi:hypothetical protein